jgi:hypothetical protein
MSDHSPLPWKKAPGNHGKWSAIIEDAEGDAVVEEITADDAELIITAVNGHTATIQACQRAIEKIIEYARKETDGIMSGILWQAVDHLRDAVTSATKKTEV